MAIRILLLFLTITGALQAQRGELYIQAGHTNQINAGAISTNNELFATGSIDNSVRIWDAGTGKLLKLLNHEDAVYALSFFKDEQTLISGGFGINTGAFKSWILPTSSYDSINWPRGLMTLSSSSDGAFLAAGSSEGYVALFDQVNGSFIRYYDLGMRESIKAIAFNSEATLMASGIGQFFGESEVHLHGTTNDSLLKSYKFDKNISKIEFVNERELLVEVMTYTTVNKVYHIDLTTDSVRFLVDMTGLCKLPDGAAFVGLTDFNEISVFQSEDYTKMRSIHIREKSISGIVASTDGSRIYTYGRGIEAIDLDQSDESMFYIPGNHWIEAMSFSSRGNKLAFNAASGAIIHWDLETGVIEPWRGHTAAIQNIAFSEDGLHLASVARDSVLMIWNESGDVTYRHKFISNSFDDLTFNRTGDFLAVGLEDTIYSINVPNGGIDNAVSFGDYNIAHMQYSPNGEDFAMLINNYVLVYDLVANVYQLEDQIGTASLEDLSFSSDGRFLAVGGYTDSLIVYDLDSQKVAYKQALLGNYVHSLDFDPTSTRLAVGYNNGSVAILDIANGEELVRFNEHENLVNELSFRNDGAVLASISWDGKLVLYNASSLTKLAELYAFEDGSWAVIDVDGRYDASNAGNIDHLHYVVQHTAIGLDQLKQRFYEPRLLQKLLGYEQEPLRDVQRLAEIPLFPKVSIDIALNTLSIQLQDQGGGIGKIQLFVNDKELVEDLAISSFELIDSITYMKQVDLLNFERFLKEENSVSVQAYNEAGFLVSQRTKLNYRPYYPPPPPPVYVPDSDSIVVEEQKETGGFGFIRKPKLYGIVIGTSNYAGEKLDLQFADKDAAAFGDALHQTGTALFGEGLVDVRILRTNDTIASGLPDKANIRQAFAQLAEEANPMDVLVVYLSGHGITYNDAGQSQFHYLTMAVSSGELEDDEVRKNQTISSEELTDWIKEIPVEKQVLIIDACASGQAIEDILMAQKNVSSGQIRALERMKDRTGMFILTGSASDKVSFEASRFGQSLLTYSILSGIKGQALREGEFVDVLQLFEHAVERVPELAAYIGGIQKPILAIPYGGNSFDIGRMSDSVEIELAVIKPVFIRSNFQDEFEYDDVLSLSDQIDNQFRNISARSKSTDFIFVDVNRYPDAYSIKGRYQTEDGAIQLSARVFKGKEKVGEFDIDGQSSNLDQLINAIIAKAQQLVVVD